MDGEEWSVAAVGPEKRRLAEQLLERLRARFATGALLHYGHGKWYPGEALPRWAFTCYWRNDGVPLWHDRQLLACEDERSCFGPLEAQRFAETLANRLGVHPEYANPAFEDPLYYLQKERQLPVNVDPVDNHLEDPGERERVRQVFQRGLNRPTGFVLPLQRGRQARPRVADRPVDAPRPASLPHPRRFAHRTAAAAAESAVGRALGAAAVVHRRSHGQPRPAARAATHLARRSGVSALAWGRARP